MIQYDLWEQLETVKGNIEYADVEEIKKAISISTQEQKQELQGAIDVINTLLVDLSFDRKRI